MAEQKPFQACKKRISNLIEYFIFVLQNVWAFTAEIKQGSQAVEMNC